MPSKHVVRVVLSAVVLVGATTVVTALGIAPATGEETNEPEAPEAVNEPAGGGASAPGGAASGGAETTLSASNEATYVAALLALSGDASGPHTLNITDSFTIAGGADPTYSGSQPLTINGNGNTINGGGNSRILFNSSGQPVAVNDLTLTDGVTNGDGAAIFSDGALTLDNCTFTDNISDDDGGAVSVDGDDLSVTGCTFTDNTAEDEGGALHHNDSGTIGITDSTFTGNEAEDDGGGAVQIDDGGVLTVSGSTFTGNVADSQGGAIEADEAGVTVRTSDFIDNESDSDGGAIDSAASAEVTDSFFDGNLASGDGGAVDTSDEGSNLVIDGSTFVDNEATSEGAAVEAEQDVTATNSTFTDNNGAEDIVNAEDGDVTFRHVTFVDNVTVANDPDDGAIDTDGDGTFTSFGSAYARNAPATCENDFVSVVSEGYNHADDDSCGLNSGPGDVENGPDPQVVALGDFGGATLTRPPALPDSPLIDAIPVAACYPGIDVDQRDLPRPEDGDGDGTNGCDIGAVEVQAQEEPPPDTGPVAGAPTFTG